MAILYQRNKKNGVTYVFDAQSYYVPSLHQSRKKKRLIGKLDPISGEVIPTGPRGRPRKKPLAPAEAQEAQEAPEAQREPERSALEAAKLKLAECAQTIDQLNKTVSDLRAENAEQKRTISDLSSKIERIQRILNG